MNPAAVSILLTVSISAASPQPARVGSKTFTESVILGEIITQLLRHSGEPVLHRRELGGTQILWHALKNGDIDAYPEYTGTLEQEIFSDQSIARTEDLHRLLADHGIEMTAPLGFSNNYVLGMKKERARALDIDAISDLRNHPDLKFGFSNEFMARGDGWPSLKAHYRLPHTNVRGMHHDIAYRGVANGTVDVTDLYSTDAEIAYYDLATLKDDLRHFPDYASVILYRKDLAERAPEALTELRRIEGKISETHMIQMNKQVKIDRRAPQKVASTFLAETLDIRTEFVQQGMFQRLRRTTWAHLNLVVKSMVPAILLAIPLGVISAKRPRTAQIVLAVVGIIQTIPALALLVLLMTMLQPLRTFGIESLGEPPAIVALFLYSLLPIVRNTYTGIHGIPASITESAEALGLPWTARLWKIELPLASSTILAGIKTAAVINVGFATLGALIGAGGYGQPILTGINLNDTGLILEGAIPAALLALAVQGLFELADRIVVPKGLRLDAARRTAQ